MGIIFSSIITLFLTFNPPTQGPYVKPVLQNPINNESAESIQSTEPSTRLKISTINVDTSIRPVGLASDGAMVSPKSPNDVVWYKLGPRPGEIGSAVIAGHYGHWKNGQGSAFDDLDKLKKGDALSVEDGKGAVTTFVVREIRSYDPSADASDVFISNDGKAHLNLITCEGVWNKISKSYSKRLVVFTDKE